MLLDSCLKTCEMLRNMISPNPGDRGELSDITSSLRDLATNTTAHVDAIVAQTLAARVAPAPLIGHPPAVEAPAIAPASGLPAAGPVRAGSGRIGGAPADAPSVERVHLIPPPVAAPHAERGAGNGSGPPSAGHPAAMEATDAPNAVMLHLKDNVAGAPLLERVHLAPPSVAAPIVEGGPGKDSEPPAAGPSVAVEPTEPTNAVMPSLEENTAGAPSVKRVHLAPPAATGPITEGDIGDTGAAGRGSKPLGLGPHGSATPAAAVGLLATAPPPPVVASHAEEGGDGTGAAAPPVEAVDTQHNSLPPVADPLVEAEAIEAANSATPHSQELVGGTPSMGRVHPPLPPVVVAPCEEGRGDDADSERSPADAIGAPPCSEPPAAATPEEAEAADADTVSLEEIKGCMDLIFRPFPRMPAEVLANHMEDALRTLGCPPPRASSPSAGQAYRSSNGGGGESGADG